MAGASFFYPHAARMKKLLILSVGYGQGHHAAAAALAEEYSLRGWSVRVADPCAEAYPRVFVWTQRFYAFCVRRASWLWGITYAQTDTADWSKAVRWPLLGGVKEHIRLLLRGEEPDVVLCTYPLYAYMLDALRRQGAFHGHYAIIVTDALEISRPWMQSAAPLLFVPDEYSCEKVCAAFGLSPQQVIAGGFPVKRAFAPAAQRQAPSAACLHILFGAFRPSAEVARAVRAILQAYPAAKLTLLGASRYASLSCRLGNEISRGQVELLPMTPHMPRLMAQSHVYIGKAGAATMFECYAAALPMIVNFALPGQEQGNLELLQRDGAGEYAESPEALVEALQKMLANGAAEWRSMSASMVAAHARRGGAARIADEVERRLLS